MPRFRELAIFFGPKKQTLLYAILGKTDSNLSLPKLGPTHRILLTRIWILTLFLTVFQKQVLALAGGSKEWQLSQRSAGLS